MTKIQEIRYNDRGISRKRYQWGVPKDMREVCQLKKGDTLDFNGVKDDRGGRELVELIITRKADIIKRQVADKEEELNKLKVDSDMVKHAYSRENK